MTSGISENFIKVYMGTLVAVGTFFCFYKDGKYADYAWMIIMTIFVVSFFLGFIIM
jgi:hypothetical protein